MMKIKELIRIFARYISDWKLERRIKWKIKHGYIEPDGTPIKCIYCDSTELEDFNECYIDGYGSTLTEYSVRCKECGKTVSTWCCGYWDIY